MANHFVGYISFSNEFLDNTAENRNMVMDFLREVKNQNPEIFNIDYNDIGNIPFFQGSTIHTMPIPLNCELIFLKELQILQLSNLKNVPDELLGLSCRISGKFLSTTLEEIRKVDSIESLNKIEGYHLWTGTDSELFHTTSQI